MTSTSYFPAGPSTEPPEDHYGAEGVNKLLRESSRETKEGRKLRTRAVCLLFREMSALADGDMEARRAYLAALSPEAIDVAADLWGGSYDYDDRGRIWMTELALLKANP